MIYFERSIVILGAYKIISSTHLCDMRYIDLASIVTRGIDGIKLQGFSISMINKVSSCLSFPSENNHVWKICVAKELYWTHVATCYYKIIMCQLLLNYLIKCNVSLFNFFAMHSECYMHQLLSISQVY